MIGIYIGSFNPPTQAHLEISLKALEMVEKIAFVPVNSKEKELISIDDRINMLNIYKKKYSSILVDDIMKSYSYLNYRIINILKKKYQNIILIIGSDLLNSLDSYDNYHYLLSNYSFIVIPRDHYDINCIIKKKYLKYQNKFKILDYSSNISSTIVREKLKNNDSLQGLLDKDVYLYIKNNHLYF